MDIYLRENDTGFEELNRAPPLKLFKCKQLQFVEEYKLEIHYLTYLQIPTLLLPICDCISKKDYIAIFFDSFQIRRQHNED